MELRTLFKENPNIIVNTDIDGILSGLILVKYLDCKIVGFSNSYDTVWLADGYDDLYKHVYVDMFVTDSRALCLDQHVVAVNSEHQDRITRSGTKFSPQIDGNRIFTREGFANKYPFGTVQYLIAVLESEGISIELPSLDTPVPNSTITVGDLIHRADDAMNSTLYSYMKNAKHWWEWLREKSNNAQVINDLINYLEAIRIRVGVAPGKKDEAMKRYVEDVKRRTKAYFSTNFRCTHGDGGYKKIVDASGNLEQYFSDYVQAIGRILNCDQVVLPDHYHAHVGKYNRTRWLDLFEEDFLKDYTICGHKVFSYAFIYGPDNDGKTNFSFTTDLE